MRYKSIITSLLGIPIDCSGLFTGVERMPAALRAAGVAQELNVPDLGDLPVRIDIPLRDPETGITGFYDVCKVSASIRDELVALLQRGERPLLVGGCCTLLIGVFAALRKQFGRAGLAFIDGHLDFYDGLSSLTGEAADMELAILTGLGPAGLVDLAGSPPLVEPRDVIALGPRDAEQARRDGAPDPLAVAPGFTLFDVQAVRQTGPAALGGQAAKRFEELPGRFWLHLDLDVLDQEILPAVDYTMPGGLDWEEITALLQPLAHSPAFVGMDITIYNPGLDPDGRFARQIVRELAGVLARNPEKHDPL